MPPKITMPVAERLEQLSIPVTECGCQIWTAGTFKTGYGCLMVHRKSFYAHRLAWETRYGPIPSGLCVLHRCDIPACINPDHLFLGTKADNIADMNKKGRGNPRSGEKHPHAKLTKDDILAIRLSKDGPRELGRRFGISHSGIVRIKKRKIWKDIEN